MISVADHVLGAYEPLRTTATTGPGARSGRRWRRCWSSRGSWSRRCEAARERLSCAVDRRRLLVDDEEEIGHEEVGVELEGELFSVLRLVDRALGLGGVKLVFDEREPACLERDGAVADRAGLGVELGGDGGKEAPTGVGAGLDVAQEQFGELLRAL